MENKTANYKIPFGKIKGSITPFEKRQTDQAHTYLELNRLNVYINKLKKRMTSLPVEIVHRGARYRNLKRRLETLLEHKAKLSEKKSCFFPKKKRKGEKQRRKM